MAGPGGFKWLRASRAELFETDRGTPKHLHFLRHPSRLVRGVRTRAQPRGRVCLACVEVHPRGSGWVAADWVPPSPADHLEQGADGAHQNSLLVPTRALLVRPEKERAMV